MTRQEHSVVVLRTTAGLLRTDKELIERLDKPEEASDVADALEDIADIFAAGKPSTNQSLELD